MKYCSVYVEQSQKDNPFKTRKDYKVDWTRIKEAAKAVGMIEMIEIQSQNTRCIITYWSGETSYEDWLRNPSVQAYIRQRDDYNLAAEISSSLYWTKVLEEKSWN
jgi:hypothetical protein